MITSEGAHEGYAALAAPTFRNAVRARCGLRASSNRPVTRAAQVTCPVLLVVAEQDNVAPTGAVHRAARRLGDRAEVVSLDCGHWDVYAGPWFERTVDAQVAFLTRVTAPRAPAHR